MFIQPLLCHWVFVAQLNYSNRIPNKGAELSMTIEMLVGKTFSIPSLSLKSLHLRFQGPDAVPELHLINLAHQASPN